MREIMSMLLLGSWINRQQGVLFILNEGSVIKSESLYGLTPDLILELQ